MVSWDEVFRTLWEIEAYRKAKEKRKQDKREERLYKQELKEELEEIKLEKQLDMKRLKEEAPKIWWMFEVRNSGGYQLKEPFFSIVYTTEVRELCKKVENMLECMEAEGRENEVRQIEEYIKANKLPVKLKKKRMSKPIR